ncbi:hypothetical protein ACHAWF_018700 [Thalassiosira exigua]
MPSNYNGRGGGPKKQDGKMVDKVRRRGGRHCFFGFSGSNPAADRAARSLDTGRAVDGPPARPSEAKVVGDWGLGTADEVCRDGGPRNPGK